MHRLLCIGLWICCLAGMVCGRCKAQSALHTRVFRTSGGYPSVVAVAPSGTVVAKIWDSSELTVLDGYGSKKVSMPNVITYRVQQSRSGQIWTVSNEGLWLHHANTWTLYTLPE